MKKEFYPDLRLYVPINKRMDDEHGFLVIPIAEAFKLLVIDDNMIKIRQYVQEYLDSRETKGEKDES
jgi:hypothetical protein